jgi:hypothetical protein
MDSYKTVWRVAVAGGDRHSLMIHQVTDVRFQRLLIKIQDGVYSMIREKKVGLDKINTTYCKA